MNVAIHRVACSTWVEESSVEIIDFIAWWLTLDFAIEKIANISVIKHFILDAHDRASDFPVSLSIELVGPDEDGARLLGGLQQDQVRRHSIILVNFDNVTNSETCGGDRLESTILLELTK